MSFRQVIARAFRYIIKGIPTNKVIATISQMEGGKRLLGKNIIITGGGSGLGHAMAKQFLKEGATVLITGRNEQKLKEASEELGCKYEILDVNQVDKFKDFIKDASELLGGIDCLVNNAGISLHERNFFEVSPESWDAQINTNLKGPYFLSQEFLNYLITNQRRGDLLFISSETGDTVDYRPYGYTKAAINSMVKGLAYMFKNMGIRINALAPGITASEMTGFTSQDNLYAHEYGQGRFYIAEEIAEVATFLLSPLSDCISGQVITCNNAQTVNACCKQTFTK